METLEVLRQIIADKFEKDPQKIAMDTTLEALQIDSLDIFDVIFEAEERFGIRVPNEEVAISTVGEVVELIERLRGNQAA